MFVSNRRSAQSGGYVRNQDAGFSKWRNLRSCIEFEFTLRLGYAFPHGYYLLRHWFCFERELDVFIPIVGMHTNCRTRDARFEIFNMVQFEILYWWISFHILKLGIVLTLKQSGTGNPLARESNFGLGKFFHVALGSWATGGFFALDFGWPGLGFGILELAWRMLRVLILKKKLQVVSSLTWLWQVADSLVTSSKIESTMLNPWAPHRYIALLLSCDAEWGMVEVSILSALSWNQN